MFIHNELIIQTETVFITLVLITLFFLLHFESKTNNQYYTVYKNIFKITCFSLFA